jgi:16S rRNA (cytosine967-C5)-methyltransferase
MADARNTALKVLITLERERQTLDGILDDITPRTDSLARRDRALFNALIYGVLRWRGRLDYIISHFSNTPLKKIEPDHFSFFKYPAKKN